MDDRKYAAKVEEEAVFMVYQIFGHRTEKYA